MGFYQLVQGKPLAFWINCFYCGMILWYESFVSNLPKNLQYKWEVLLPSFLLSFSTCLIGQFQLREPNWKVTEND